MKIISPSGKEFNIKNVNKYLVNWDEKSRSNFQFEAKQFLKRYWRTHIVFEEFPVPKTKMSLDFFNLSLNVAVEVQGSQHTKYNKFFHGNTNYKYLQQLKRDQQKYNFCEDYGITLVEVYSRDELTKEFFKKFDIIL